MHNLEDIRNAVDREVVESEELLGRECATCFRILRSKFFRRDSSTKDGLSFRCYECESTPSMSMAENTAMLRERNNNSDAIKKLRPTYMDSMRCDIGRIGRVLWCNDFLEKLKSLLPGLMWIEGKIEGDLSVYLVDHATELGYRYLWYIERGILPEFSLWEFDERDFPIREKKRGWRTPLLRCILAGLVYERDAEKVFGRAPEGLASQVWYQKLYEHRNAVKLTP